MLVDTGCDHTLAHTDLDPYLRRRRKANVGTQVASTETMAANPLVSDRLTALTTNKLDTPLKTHIEKSVMF